MNKREASIGRVLKKSSKIETIFWITLFVLFVSFFLGVVVIYPIVSSQKAKRLKTEGICTIVTVTKILEKVGKGGYGARVKYLVGDSIVHSSFNTGYNTRLKPNAQYWARYLPDKPQFVSLLRDENDKILSVVDSLKLPSICNCKNVPDL